VPVALEARRNGALSASGSSAAMEAERRSSLRSRCARKVRGSCSSGGPEVWLAVLRGGRVPEGTRLFCNRRRRRRVGGK